MRYFKPSEFACPCCGAGSNKMNAGLLLNLDAARHMSGAVGLSDEQLDRLFESAMGVA